MTEFIILFSSLIYAFGIGYLIINRVFRSEHDAAAHVSVRSFHPLRTMKELVSSIADSAGSSVKQVPELFGELDFNDYEEWTIQESTIS